MQTIQDKHIAVEHEVLKTLLYFDIFKYPLKSEEVFRFLGMNSISQADVDVSLHALTTQQYVFEQGGFFAVQPIEALVARRLRGNDKAQTSLPIAFRKAEVIARFPFVRAVFASGSLSKNFMDEHSDIDFFIVTAPGRLWIARTLLVLYKRLVLLNSHQHFCVNYFVDEDHLEIEEKNLFTATELATILPLHNAGAYKKILAANGWMKTYYPNFRPRGTTQVGSSTSSVKRVMESLLNLVAPVLERTFMRMTLNRWKRIYEKEYPQEAFEVAFKTKTYASKNHPKLYQQKVIQLHEQKIVEFCNKHKIVIPHD